LEVSSAAIYAAEKSITATADGRLQCSRLVDVTLHCPYEKSALRCGLSSKFFVDLFVIVMILHVAIDLLTVQLYFAVTV